MNRKTETTGVYARITEEIIKAIKVGEKVYEMPWHKAASSGMPRNALTGNTYRGVNIIALWAASQLQGYPKPIWASYLQWAQMGAQVRKGEKSSTIVYYKPGVANGHDEMQDLDKKVSRAILLKSSIFNVAQVDGYCYQESEREDTTKCIERVDAFVEALGVEIVYRRSIAAYNPVRDYILMPNREEFINTKTRDATEGYYSVLLHEHVHWSGHPTRLHRDLSGRFGTEAYAMEELIAELGAAFLCAELGISVLVRHDHATYVNTWLKVLENDDRAIFVAAGMASTACQFLSSKIAQSVN